MEILLLEVKEDSERVGTYFINIDGNYYLWLAPAKVLISASNRIRFLPAKKE
jgi:hypothetical protein